MTDNLELEKTLWAAADKLRNNIDAAGWEYNECFKKIHKQ